MRKSESKEFFILFFSKIVKVADLQAHRLCFELVDRLYLSVRLDLMELQSLRNVYLIYKTYDVLINGISQIWLFIHTIP